MTGELRARRDIFLRFREDESAWSTALCIAWSLVLLIVAGLAIDSTNAWRHRAMLQVAADAAAHAGALKLPVPGVPISSEDRETIRSEAIRIARENLPPSIYGEVVPPEAVKIGRWDDQTRMMDTTVLFPNAVRVTARETGAGRNAVATFLLKLAGLPSFDVGANALVQRFTPACTRDGIISAEYSELTSGNDIKDPFCLHGEQGVSMSNSNTFELGTIVSMPDFAMLELPTAGYGSNPGLEEALSEGHLYPRMVTQIDHLFEELQDIRSPEQPPYVKYGMGHTITLTDSQFDATTLSPGNLYIVECGNVTGRLQDTSSNKMIKLGSTARVVENVIVTNCAVQISAGALLTNATVLTSNTGSSSISGNSGAVIGAPDNCTAGGGASLISMGHISFPSTAEFHEAQLIARATVSLAAAAGGIKGIQVQAGGFVKLTASGGFALCPNRADPPYQADYYRFVQ